MKYQVTVNFKHNDTKEFETFSEAMKFARKAKENAHFVEVHEEREPAGSTRCFRLVTRFRDGAELHYC